MNGIINILKPPGMTSHDVVYLIRKVFGIKRVGHTGTLDPGAAGVLPVCLAKATRIIEYLPDEKMYRAEISFGRSTTTQDAFGDTVEERFAGDLNARQVERELACFRGSIKQLPPMASAVKHRGKKLYELARAGLEVERKLRTVYIYQLDLIDFVNNQQAPPKAVIDVRCSAGTYIRTICHDLGEKLGCGAHMSFLLRTKAGSFALESAVTLEEVREKHQAGITEHLIITMENALKHLPRVRIDEQAANAVACGKKLFLPLTAVERMVIPLEVVCIEGPDGLLALARVTPVAGKPDYRAFQPIKVLV